jgi:exodeoxyribonuclease-3
MPKAAPKKTNATTKAIPSAKASSNLKIATFNANSIRARMPILLDWLKKEQPDVLGVQETKVQDHEFPKDVIQAAGWNVIFHGQKSYNGVAFISKKPMTILENRLYPKDKEEQARLLVSEYDGVKLINTYIPQGYAIDSEKYQYKLKFYADLKKYFDKNVSLTSNAIWMGDLNVAPTEIDLNNPKGNKDHPCYHVDAREALTATMKGKWTDLFREKEKGPGHYTFWDMRQPQVFAKNLGWRIDFLMGTPPMVSRLQKIWIDTKPRGLEKPSDHTFLIGEFSK